MFSKNFYFRLKYQLKKSATFDTLFQYFLDRIKHPFNKIEKKRFKENHKNYLITKKTTTDYFSLNAYYWDLIINKNFKEFSYLEIGSWEGNSALYILKNFTTKKVVCVDIWDLYDDKYKEEHLKRFENFNYNLKEFEKKFTFFKNTSDKFFEINKERFDLIYIDGSHDAQQVYKDICNSWAYLNHNGIIVCDDYFYGNISSDKNENVPALSINRFLRENKDMIQIICVNNTQIFFKKIK